MSIPITTVLPLPVAIFRATNCYLILKPCVTHRAFLLGGHLGKAVAFDGIGDYDIGENDRENST